MYLKKIIKGSNEYYILCCCQSDKDITKCVWVEHFINLDLYNLLKDFGLKEKVLIK